MNPKIRVEISILFERFQNPEEIDIFDNYLKKMHFIEDFVIFVDKLDEKCPESNLT
ncbi:MAG: hypothetical protein KJN68_05010 [Bacteroidia bacterium]|nr:hypothetical protein [Bacteroidia bacterium]